MPPLVSAGGDTQVSDPAANTLARQVHMRAVLEHLVEGTAAATGEAFFQALVRSLSRALDVRWAFVAQLDPDKTEAQIRAIWAGADFGDNFSYSLVGTPCEKVVRTGLCHFPSDVARQFPDDAWLADAGVEGYMAIPLVDERGEPVGHLGIMDSRPMPHEPTKVSLLKIFAARAAAELARLRDEAALADKARELERSNEELARFAHAAAHDLQQPLTQVMGFIDLLRNELGDELNPRRARYITAVADGATRMSQLIDSLLAYARAGGSRLDLSEVPLGETIDQAQEQLASEIERTGAVIEVGPLPSVRSAPQSLVRVFQNLLANAIKFTEATPHIRVTARRVPGAWAVDVADDGIGIPPEDHARIFEAFERLHSRGHYPGSGIGLATCKKLIERLGGTITLQSAPGAGSTFTVTLPDA